VIEHAENFITSLDFWEEKVYNKSVKNIHNEVAYGYDENKGGAGCGKARQLIKGGAGFFLHALGALTPAGFL
jgi:hypothetical protein